MTTKVQRESADVHAGTLIRTASGHYFAQFSIGGGGSARAPCFARARHLRGTFVTLALAAGRTEAWVTDRTGHRSSAMIYLYKRAARTASELGLGWLAPLDESIPELSSGPRQGANGVQTGSPTGRGRSPGRSKTSGKSHFATGRVTSAAIANPLYVGSNPILTSRPISGGRDTVRSNPARRSPHEVACPAGRIAACDAVRG
jgi:hypothetical protein